MDSPQATPTPVSLRHAIRIWCYIGLNSFGGPAGHVALMHRELVERRRWISERRFLHALNFCMVLPGPEAQQLATYIGWLMNGRRGALVAGSLFVLPGFVIMLALSIAYALYGSVGWVAGVLLGIQAAVIAIVAEAFLRISKRTVRGAALAAIASASFIAITFFNVLFPAILVIAALIGWLLGRSRSGAFPNTGGADESEGQDGPSILPDDERVDGDRSRSAMRAGWLCAALWLTPVAALLLVLGADNLFSQQAVLFSQGAVVTFGGAYAVLAFIAQEAVNRYQWVTSQDMVTGVGLAETTPGPLILVVQFVAFLAAFNNPGDLSPVVAGVLGATLAIWVTFLPCFMFIFFGAPYVERLRESRALRHCLTSMGAAIAGVVLSLALWFTLTTAFGAVEVRTIGPVSVDVPVLTSVNWATIVIAAIAGLLVFRFKVGTLKVLATSAAIGLLITLVIPTA